MNDEFDEGMIFFAKVHQRAVELYGDNPTLQQCTDTAIDMLEELEDEANFYHEDLYAN